MAVSHCHNCGGTDMQTLADRERCLTCGAYQTVATHEPAEGGLVWTSPEPDSVFDRPPAQSEGTVLKNSFFKADHPTHEMSVAPFEEQLEAQAALREEMGLPPLEAEEGEEGEVEVIEVEDYADLTNDELRAELEGRGLATSGTKAEMVARLEEDDASVEQPA